MSGIVGGAGSKSGLIGSTEIPGGYETGTWTCGLLGETGGSGITATGYYTKIGNECSVNVQFEDINNNGYSGRIQFSGFPFSGVITRSLFSFAVHFALTYESDQQDAVCFLDSGTVGQIYNTRSGASWEGGVHNGGTGRYFIIAGSYIVA